MNGHHPGTGTSGRSRRLGWRHLRWVLAAATVPVALWACNSHPLQETPPAPQEQTDIVYEVNPVRKLDLLFVVDNSNSMAQEQANLKRNFPRFMDELLAIKPTPPDMHIAVISSNVGAGQGTPAPECRPGGDRGGFQSLDACGLMPQQNGYFLKIGPDQKTNFEFKGGLAALPDVFGCMAELGVRGCGYEHQLLSMYFALDGNTNKERNAGFLRPDAYLGIVILSDEDDCSGPPTADFYDGVVPGQAGSLRCGLRGHVCDGKDVTAMPFSTNLANCQAYVRPPGEPENSRLINIQTFVDFVKSLKSNPADRILVSSVIGWDPSPTAKYELRQGNTPRGPELDLAPICDDPATGSAAPGIRLHTFTKAFKNNTVHSICQADLSQSMKEIGTKLRTILENTCITSPLYPTGKPGVPADCQVADQIPLNDGTPRVRETALPSCAADASRTCWKLVEDPMCGSNYRVEVERKEPAAPGTLQSIRCLTCPMNSTDPGCRK